MVTNQKLFTVKLSRKVEILIGLLRNWTMFNNFLNVSTKNTRKLFRESSRLTVIDGHSRLHIRLQVGGKLDRFTFR